jgi:hypothetical protein
VQPSNLVGNKRDDVIPAPGADHPGALRTIGADANFTGGRHRIPAQANDSAFGKKQDDGVESPLYITPSTTRPNPHPKGTNLVKSVQISDADDLLRCYAAILCACEPGRIWIAP